MTDLIKTGYCLIDAFVLKLKNNREFKNFILLIHIFHSFGSDIAIKSLADTVARRTPFEAVYRRTHILRYNACKKYLLKNYSKWVEKQKNKYIECDLNEIEKLQGNYNVWVFWWQGLDTAPNIVQTCVKSIRNYADKHTVVIISKYNYSNYIDMPQYILDKLDNGKIALAHFSDVFRLMLIAKYGGIWVDATLLMTGRYTLEVDRNSFYTIKHLTDRDWHICGGKWATFFLAGAKNDPTICFCRDFLLEYWRRESYLLCYLLFDCILQIGYEEIRIITEEIDSIPVNNTGVFQLLYGDDKKISTKELTDSLKRKTDIHKLTYKRVFKESINGEKTLFGSIKEIALLEKN